MAPRTRALPQKRSPEDESMAEEMSPMTKKSKAEIRRQSLSRAKQWAADRKRKNDGGVDDDAKKSKPDVVAEEEAKDVAEELPSIPARRTTRRRGTSKVVAAALEEDSSVATTAVDDESVSTRSTRRSSRRRTVNVAAATETKAKEEKKAPRTTRKNSRRKSVAPVVTEIKEEVQAPEVSPVSLPEVKEEEEEVPAKIEVEEEVAVETEKTEEAASDEEVAKEERIEESVEEIQEAEPQVEVKDLAQDVKEPAAEEFSVMGSLLKLTPMFFHALSIQWTVTFAVILAFAYDWWLSHLGPDYDEQFAASQQSTCFTLALWLVTIAGYAIAFGPGSRAGWILTGSALSMMSFSTKLMASNGVTSVPSLPIYSHSGFSVNVPDLLVVLSLVGFAAALTQHKEPVPEQSQEVAASEETTTEDAVTESESPEQGEIQAEANGPRSLIGQRVAVEKGGDAIVGTVKDYDPETREWTVHFDDEFQSEEEMNRLQLTSAFKLHSKHLSDNIKAMWRAGEL